MPLASLLPWPTKNTTRWGLCRRECRLLPSCCDRQKNSTSWGLCRRENRFSCFACSQKRRPMWREWSSLALTDKNHAKQGPMYKRMPLSSLWPTTNTTRRGLCRRESCLLRSEKNQACCCNAARVAHDLSCAVLCRTLQRTPPVHSRAFLKGSFCFKNPLANDPKIFNRLWTLLKLNIRIFQFDLKCFWFSVQNYFVSLKHNIII